MPVRLLARPLLAAVFVAGGADAVRDPSSRAGAAEPVTRRLPAPLRRDPEVLVRLNGAVQVTAGLALATGRLRRLAALALAGSLVPTTLAGHAFWQHSDGAARKQHLIHFQKNLGLLGGLLIAAVDTGGRPSVTWRARQAARSLGEAAQGQPVGAARRALAALTR